MIYIRTLCRLFDPANLTYFVNSIRMEVMTMENHNEIQLFEDRRIRTAWDGEKEEWYFSVVDVVGVLTEQTIGFYWKDDVT